jgi:hypothetical protein
MPIPSLLTERLSREQLLSCGQDLQYFVCDIDALRCRVCTVNAKNGIPVYEQAETRWTTTTRSIKMDAYVTGSSFITTESHRSDGTSQFRAT